MRYPTPAEFAEAKAHGGRTPQQRLDAAYLIEASGCWHWLMGKTSSGYGHFHFKGRYYQAHRLVYGLLRGPVLTVSIDHLCRNRWCVNPDHLEPVSPAENVRRGKAARLTPERVRQIHSLRAQGLSQRAIGRRMKVDHSTICRVLKGQRWPEYMPQVTKEVAA